MMKQHYQKPVIEVKDLEVQSRLLAGSLEIEVKTDPLAPTIDNGTMIQSKPHSFWRGPQNP